MKKILLFLGVVLFALFQNKASAQNPIIDSIVRSDIQCPGQTGALTVYISNTAGVNFDLVLQKANSAIVMVTNTTVLNTTVTSYTFSPLQDGIYQVLLTTVGFLPYPTALNYDASNDPNVFDAEVDGLVDPEPLSVVPSDFGLFCAGDSTANINVVVTGFTSPYEVWLEDDNGTILSGPTILGLNDTTHIFPLGLEAGDYTICATDANSCPTLCVSHTIDTVSEIVATAQIITPISCYDADDGQIDVSVSGGTPFSPPSDPYSYSWTGPANYSANTFSIDSLAPGNYTCIISDTFGCPDTVSLSLIEPDSLGASTSFTNPICFDDNNGSIIITLSSTFQGSGGPFQYSQNGGATWVVFSDTFVVLNNLPAGVYTNNRVMDIAGCVFELPPDTLIEPPLLEFSYDTLSYNGFGVSCFNKCDAELTIDSVWGGNLPPYGTSASFYGGVAFIDTLLVNDTCAGFYTDTVTDSEGCIGSDSITINEPDSFFIDYTAAVKSNGYNLSCADACDGEITVTPTNGVNMITYAYINNVFDSAFSPGPVTTLPTACATPSNGDTLIAIDDNGCIAIDTVNLSSPPPFLRTMGEIDENCNADNGQAWVNFTGGLPPYQYNWTSSIGLWGPISNSGSFTSDTIKQLSFGSYYLEVTDDLNCSFYDTAFVDSSFIKVDTILQVPCNGIDNGSITIITDGLMTEVILLLVDGAGILPEDTIAMDTSFYDVSGNLVINPNINDTMTFNGLGSSAGSLYYSLRVEKSSAILGGSGCNPQEIIIELGSPITMDAFLDSANSVLGLDCFGDETDSVFINVQETFGNINSPNGNAFYAFRDADTNNVAISLTGNSNYLQNGKTLPSGNYDIIVVPQLDEFNNCVDTVSISIIEPDSLQFTLGSVQTLCFGDSTGSIFVDTIFGGNTGNYKYTWTDADTNVLAPQMFDNVTSLPAGWYYLSVVDSLDCLPPTIDSIEVTEPDSIFWTTTITGIDSCGTTNAVGEIVITSTGGSGIITYLWEGFNSLGAPYTSTNATNGALVSGDHYVTITDTNGCFKSDTITIPNGKDPALDSNSFVNVSCFGLHDGSYDAIVDSVNGSMSFPYIFWNPDLLPSPNYQSGYIPSGDSLGPGDTIVIRVGDNFGCETILTHIITEPALLEITNIEDSTYIGGYNVSCNGSLDGELTVHAVGGTRDYTFWIQDSTAVNPSSSDSVFSALASTYYKTFVEDHNGCLDSLDIFLTQPDSLLVDSFNLSTYVGGWNVSCLGEDDGSASVFVSGGNLGYSYVWSNGDTTNIADTLSAGPYTVIVTDTNGCIDSASIILIEPNSSLVIDSIVPTHLDCKGGDNGNATVFVSGATPGYTYLWDNANSTMPTYFNPNDTVPSFDDISAFADTLRAGTYNVQVLDANGCYVTGSITITEPSISINIDSLAVTQMTCFTYNDASVLIITTGPQSTPNLYTLYNEADPLDTIKPFTISPGTQGNIGFSGLGPLTHVVYVQDDLGCIDRDTFTINPLDQIYIDTIIYSNVSCNGYNDGYIDSIVPMGGTPPYEYNIDGGMKYPSWACTVDPNTCPLGKVFTGLNPGLHTIGIEDANGCVSSYNVTISEPPTMIINYSTNNYNNYEIACHGDSDEVIFNIAGAVAPYDIMLNNDTETTNATFTWTGLLVGVHNFDIVAANGCQESVSVTLNQPQPIAVNPFVTDVFCTDSCSGEITAVVSGGVGQGIGTNYTYQWLFDDPAMGWMAQPGEISYYIDSLCEGNYALEITDNNNCVDSFLVPIGQDALNIITANSTITNVGCYGDCDGSITVEATGGVPSANGDYTYLWNDPLNQTTKTAIGLCAGTYTCIVTDMAGCVVTKPFDVTQNDKFIATITSQQAIDCYGGKGSLKVTTSGGTLPIPINGRLWSSGGSNQIESNLLAGTYSCFVTDANGCTDTAFYTLSEPDQLEILATDIDVTNVGCKGDATGEILIEATGGTPVPGIPGYYTYVLSGPSTSPLIQMATANFTALLPGIYTVTVTDANGCTVTSNDIFVDEPENPLTVTIDAQDETCAAAACAIIYPSGGTKSYSYKWDNDPLKPYVPGNCDPLSATDNTPHTVIVTDTNGCEATASITLLGYLNIFLPDNASTFSAEYCYGEEVEIDIQTSPNLSYVWTMDNRWTIETGDDTIISTTADLTIVTDSFWGILETEILTLTITDDNGCSKNVETTIDLNYLDLYCEVSGAGEDRLIVEGTLITFSENSGYATYEWTNSNGELLSDNSQFSIAPTESDMYNLYVTDGDCMGYCSIYVALGVIPVDVISPNGDGVNEDWYIRDLEKYDNSIVQLFNRWGDMLFEYKEEGNRISNDFYDWTDLNIGTYYYIIDLGDGSLPQTGPLTIIK
jgi:gliding motility-associated-like protein